METPAGPLTLRVYVGEDCKGTLYQDDGRSYDFKRGKFLRMDSTCSLDDKMLHIHLVHIGFLSFWRPRASSRPLLYHVFAYIDKAKHIL